MARLTYSIGGLVVGEGPVMAIPCLAAAVTSCSTSASPLPAPAMHRNPASPSGANTNNSRASPDSTA